MSTDSITTAVAPQLAQQVMKIITAFADSQTLFAADELGIFNALQAKSKDAAALAAELKLDKPHTLERLLNGCCALGLLQKKNDGTYDLTDASRTHLIKGDPAYLGGFIQHIRKELYALWQNLGHAVREDKPQWHRLPGANPKGPFETIYQDEAGLRSFMEAMFSGSYGASCEHAERFDFSSFKHIVDLGGASGAFFAAVLTKYPAIRGTIFDLPPVEKPARECMQRFGLSDRVEFTAGDFFSDPFPADADMFVLGHILHDWNDEQGTALLKKTYEALPPGGAVFIGETLLNEKKDGPPYASFMDLNMLVATTGKERTPSEYEAWLKSVGFSRTTHQVCERIKSFVVGWK
jgi:hypothetical protein